MKDSYKTIVCLSESGLRPSHERLTDSTRALPKAFQPRASARDVLVSLGIAVAVVFSATPARAQSPRDKVVSLVAQIQKADYEANRAELLRLYQALEPFVKDRQLSAKVLYWRGFARWRRAINGANDSIEVQDLAQDLRQGINDFQEAVANESGFIDAKVAAGSCMGLLLFFTKGNSLAAPEFSDREAAQAYALKALQYINESEEAQPENPRVLWVVGQTRWVTPPKYGGGRDRAFEAYEKGLKVVREQKGRQHDSLAPSWGEPELLMNLAWSNLNKEKPDIAAAERFARSALALVPNWHYVRDILLPQIVAAKQRPGPGHSAGSTYSGQRLDQSLLYAQFPGGTNKLLRDSFRFRAANHPDCGNSMRGSRGVACRDEPQ